MVDKFLTEEKIRGTDGEAVLPLINEIGNLLGYQDGDIWHPTLSKGEVEGSITFECHGPGGIVLLTLIPPGVLEDKGLTFRE